MPKKGATPALHTRCNTYGYLPPASTSAPTPPTKSKRLTCVPPRPQTQGYSAQKPSRANEPRRPVPRETPRRGVQQPHHQPYCTPSSPNKTARRRPRTARAALRALPVATRHDERQTPGSSAPARGKSRRASSGLFCRTPCRRRRHIPKPMPLSARGGER